MEERETKMSDKLLEDKIEGMLIGAAIGDALGSLFEKKRMKHIYDGTINGNWDRVFRFGVMKDGKKVNRLTAALGQYTDGTEMILCIVRSLVEHFKYNQEDIIGRYLEWANIRHNNSMGTNTKNLFKGIKTIKGYRKRCERFLNNDKGLMAQSNGCLIRCAPLALLSSDDVKTDCNLTNPNPESTQACQFQTDLIRSFLLGSKIDEIVLKDNIKQYPKLKECIEAAINGNLRDVKKHYGWALHGSYLVSWSLLRFERYDEAMDWIFSQRGDINSNMCIVGAVIGSKLGLKKILEEENTRKNYEIIMNRKGNQGDFTRDSKYLISDHYQLAKKLALVLKSQKR